MIEKNSKILHLSYLVFIAINKLFVFYTLDLYSVLY